MPLGNPLAALLLEMAMLFDPLLIAAAVEKVAGASDKDRRASRQYYQSHRSSILSHAATYRAQNAVRLSKKSKKYRKEVKMGIRKQRQRYSAGGSYIFGGFR